jgi:hypothetical protein
MHRGLFLMMLYGSEQADSAGFPGTELGAIGNCNLLDAECAFLRSAKVRNIS